MGNRHSNMSSPRDEELALGTIESNDASKKGNNVNTAESAEMKRLLEIFEDEGDNGHEKIQGIIKEKPTLCVKTNKDRLLPIHLACKGQFNTIVEVLLDVRVLGLENKELIQQQLSAATSEGDTVFHIAASDSRNAEIMATLLDKKCDKEKLEEILKKTNKHDTKSGSSGYTAIHIAAMTGNVRILEKLYRKEKSIVSYTCCHDQLPIHSACEYGHLQIVEKLIKWKSKDIEAKYTPPWHPCKYENEEDNEDFSVTPLAAACYYGHYGVVKYLLKEKAKITPVALIAAIEGNNRGCIKMIIEHKDFKKEYIIIPYKLYEDSPTVTTAFRQLIIHQPAMAEYVLNIKCVEFVTNEKPLQIKLDYMFITDRCKTLKKQETKWSCSYCCRDKTNKKPSMIHPLSLMVKYKRENLLTHPVVASFIHEMWNSRYGVFSVMFWILYMLFFLSTNVLLFLIPIPGQDNCTVTGNESTYYENCSSNGTDCKNEKASNIIDANTVFISTLSNLMCIYSFIRLLYEALQLYVSIREAQKEVFSKKSGCIQKIKEFIQFSYNIDYIWDYENWIELPLFVLAFVFSIDVQIMNYLDNLCTLPVWQWQIGIFALWLSWIELLLLSSQFKLIGIYILMFVKVSVSLLKFIPTALLLFGAFGISFHLLLYQSLLKGAPFFKTGYSFLKVTSMTTGDISSDDFFGLDANGNEHDLDHLQYIDLATIFWILSLFLLTILLSNLMIGLAVGDIEAIYKQAEYERIAMQVKSKSFDYDILPEWLENKKNDKTLTPHSLPDFIKGIRNELVYHLWGGIRYNSLDSVTMGKLISARKQAHALSATTINGNRVDHEDIDKK